jgi:hypothetical protein
MNIHYTGKGGSGDADTLYKVPLRVLGGPDIQDNGSPSFAIETFTMAQEETHECSI